MLSKGQILLIHIESMLYDLENHSLIYILFEISQIKSFLLFGIGAQRNPLIIEGNHHYFQYNKHNMIHVSINLASAMY